MAQYLTFNLGSEQFAIGILAIREIIEYSGVTAVPEMPACLLGVINLRGAAVPVLSLARRLGREPQPVGKRSCVVVVEVPCAEGTMMMGVLVDSVSAVVTMDAGDIEPAPAMGTRIAGELVLGIGKVNGRFVILLDIDRVGQAEDIAAMAAAPALPA